MKYLVCIKTCVGHNPIQLESKSIEVSGMYMPKTWSAEHSLLTVWHKKSELVISSISSILVSFFHWSSKQVG